MNTPVVIDVFKFVAVRPPQRVSAADMITTVIRDARAATQTGARSIAALASKLAQPGAAIAHWRELDLAALERLADGYSELSRRYEALDPAVSPPDAKALLKQSDLSIAKDGADPDLNGAAWNALYTAHAIGNTAGAFLETPMAALRVLHFARIVSKEPHPTRALALDALQATVAISTQFHDAFRPTSPSERPTDIKPQLAEISSEDTRRNDQIKALAADLVATQKLADTVNIAATRPVTSAPMTNQGPGEGWSARVTATTIPALSDALPASLSRVEAGILDRLQLGDSVATPVAALTLQRHMQQLSDQAATLVDDPVFQTALQNISETQYFNFPILPKPPAAPVSAAPDVDVSGRIQPLGIGDLKVVKQTLLAYEAGEVAHIENVLKGELKERNHRKLDRSETTIFTSNEESKDTERDTQSTDRFELKQEAEQTVKEDMSLKAGLTVTASYGPVVATATGDFATSTSKQSSQKSSSNFAREVVDKSVTKVQTKTITERTSKTLNEVEEINRHVLNNADASAGNITGVYRWVDKRYRAQVYNYGARLLLEFVVPEPAAFYRATHMRAAPKVNGSPPPPFLKDPNILVDPGYVGLGRISASAPLRAEDITEVNYLRYAAKYGATGIAPPPPQFTYIGFSIAPKDGVGEAKTFSLAFKDLSIPAGYQLSSYSFAASFLTASYPKLTLQVRGDYWVLANSGAGGPPLQEQLRGDVAGNNTQVSGVVPVSVVGYDIFSFAIDLQAVCVRTPEALATWKIGVFEKIQTAYQALQAAYDQKVTQAVASAGIVIEGQNPGLNRIVEKTELKKLCITMMTGQHFGQFGAVTEPPDDAAHPPEVDVLEALSEGPILQFFEQAFEWEQMTYLLYPYFWGRKKNWISATNLSDPDPMFQQFLSAGAARVLVPVPLAYVKDVQFLLQNPLKKTKLADKVWGGGDLPTLDDPLYISIADEFRNQTDDLAGATPEGDPWEFTLPTTLVWLQPDGTLPVFT